jgi:DNA repair exonuclease SbcCD ATPase subunit
MEEMKTRVNESEKLNIKLHEQLEKAAKARSEERNGLSQLNEQHKQEIKLLRQELKKVNDVRDELRNAAKKAEAELTSYKKEHDIEFNTLKNALEDSQKINESLRERLKERKEHKESQETLGNRTSSPISGVNVSQLQNELVGKTRIIESLNKKLQKYDEVKANQTSFTFPEDTEGSGEERSPKTVQIRQLQKYLEEKQKLIDALTEELNRNNKSNLESSGLADASNVNTRLSNSPRTSKDDRQGQTSFDKGSCTSRPSDVIDGASPDDRRSSRLQKEREDVYKRNDELRKAVSENITLVDLNRQLKQDLTASKQRGGVLEKELKNYATKIKDTNSEVSRLVDELARTRTLNSDYVSQLKALRRQQEQATKFREEAVNARSMNEKLSAEVQRLFASLESAGKENER